MADIEQTEQGWEDALGGMPEGSAKAFTAMRKAMESQISGALSLVAQEFTLDISEADALRKTTEDSQSLIDTAVELAMKRLIDYLTSGEGAARIKREVSNYFGTVNIDNSTLVEGDMMKWDATEGEWVKVTTSAQEVVIDMEYDVGTNKFNKNTMTVTVINPGSASGMTQITGGQLVEET